MTIERLDTPTTGSLAIWHDVEGTDAELEDLFEWYNRQHHCERYDVPGFARARRYEAVGDTSPRVFSRYDTATPDVLSSAAYRERLDNPTGWTRRSLPHYRNMSRTLCTVAQRFGRGEGGKLASARLDAEDGAQAGLVAWITGEAFPALLAIPGMIGGQLLTAAPGAVSPSTEEKRLRGAEDDRSDVIVLLTGSTVAAVTAGLALLTGANGLTAQGAAPGVATGVYELVFDLGAQG